MSAALYVTIRLALFCFVAAESGKRLAARRRVLPRWTTPISALGIGLLLTHIALAFHVRYDWSHAVAVRETARPGPHRWLGAALTLWLIWIWRPLPLDWRMS